VPVFDFIGDLHRIAAPKSRRQNVRRTVTAAVRASPGRDDRQLPGFGDQIKGGVGAGIQIVFIRDKQRFFAKYLFQQIENLFFARPRDDVIRPRKVGRVIVTERRVFAAQDNRNLRQGVFDDSDRFKNAGVPVGHHGRH